MLAAATIEGDIRQQCGTLLGLLADGLDVDTVDTDRGEQC